MQNSANSIFILKMACLLGVLALPLSSANEEISVEALKNETGPGKVIVLYNLTFTCPHRSEWCAIATVHRTIDPSLGHKVLEPIEVLPFQCTRTEEMKHQVVVELPRNGSDFSTFNEVNLLIISDCRRPKTFYGWQRLAGPTALDQFATFKASVDMNLPSPTDFYYRNREAFLKKNDPEDVEIFQNWAEGEGIDRTKFMKKDVGNASLF